MSAATRTCRACGEGKSLDHFYASDERTCKNCVKARVRANRLRNAEYYRAYDRKRYRDDPARQENAKKCGNSEAGKRSRAASIARQRAEDPKKIKARAKIQRALRKGEIERSPCFFCGTQENLQAHHEDYDLPLDVVWLCAACHGKYHTIRGDLRRSA